MKLKYGRFVSIFFVLLLSHCSENEETAPSDNNTEVQQRSVQNETRKNNQSDITSENNVGEAPTSTTSNGEGGDQNVRTVTSGNEKEVQQRSDDRRNEAGNSNQVESISAGESCVFHGGLYATEEDLIWNWPWWGYQAQAIEIARDSHNNLIIMIEDDENNKVCSIFRDVQFSDGNFVFSSVNSYSGARNDENFMSGVAKIDFSFLEMQTGSYVCIMERLIVSSPDGNSDDTETIELIEPTPIDPMAGDELRKFCEKGL